MSLPLFSSFYSQKKSSLSIVGPLGLRGSLYLDFLFYNFYRPTNHDLYSPKKRFLKEPHRGVPLVEGLSYLVFFVLLNFSPLRHKLFDFLSPYKPYPLLGGEWGGGAYFWYLSKYFWVKMSFCFFPTLQPVLFFWGGGGGRVEGAYFWV